MGDKLGTSGWQGYLCLIRIAPSPGRSALYWLVPVVGAHSGPSDSTATPSAPQLRRSSRRARTHIRCCSQALFRPDTDVRDYLMWPVLWVVLHIVRAVVIGMQYPILSRTGYGFPWRNAVLYWWAGLRGAIGLVLALIVSHEGGISQATRNRILVQTAGVVVLTLQINGALVSDVYTILGVPVACTPRPLAPSLSCIPSPAAGVSPPPTQTCH